MIIEPQTLYKLMTLHMLNQVSFPLTESQISDFFLSHDYTNYFTLKQVLGELIEAKMITMEAIHNTSRYEITDDGINTLEFFDNKIPSAITEDIDAFLKENKFKMRNEVGTTSDFYRSSNGDYIVHNQVREGKSVLITLDFTVPDEETAVHMSENWAEKSSDIYSYVMKSLMS